MLPLTKDNIELMIKDHGSYFIEHYNDLTDNAKKGMNIIYDNTKKLLAKRKYYRGIYIHLSEQHQIIYEMIKNYRIVHSIDL